MSNKCVIYARVSTKEQKEEGFSIEAQLELLKQYALQKELKIVGTFEDDESAKQSGRYNFNRMIKYLQSHSSVNTILVEKTDRLYRNLIDYGIIENLKVEVHLVKENEILSENSKSHTKFIHGIKALMAKNYSDNLSEEVIKGMNQKAKNGHYPGRAPFGYKNNRETRLIDKVLEKAYIIKRLFEWYATGKYSLKTLSDKAYDEGLAYRKSGKRFSAGSLEKILKNPIYYGDFRWKSEVMNGNHDPIISRELFDLVQYQLKRFNKPKKGKLYYPFRGLLYCGYCGCQLTAQRQSGNRYIYYNCTGARGKCPQKYIREEQIALLLGKVVQAIKIDQEIVNWIKEALKSSHADENEFHSNAISTLKREITKTETKIRSIYEDKLEGVIDTDRWKELHQLFSDQLVEMQNKLDKHSKANLNYFEEGVKILEIAESAYSQYVTRNNEGKRKLLDSMVSKCHIKGNEILAEYRQPFDMIAVTKTRINAKLDENGEVLPVSKLWRRDRDSNPR